MPFLNGDYEYYYDDDEYYEDEEEPPRKSSKPKKKKQSYNTRRRTNRRKYQEESSKDDKERVPFLVPLMMVPENQVGIEKEFSFGQKPEIENQKDDDGVFTSILNLNDKKGPPIGNRIPPRSFFFTFTCSSICLPRRTGRFDLKILWFSRGSNEK